MLVTKSPPPVLDVPAASFVFEDPGFGRGGQCLLVERVGDDFAQRVGNRPVLEDTLDIEIELAHASILPLGRELCRTGILIMWLVAKRPQYRCRTTCSSCSQAPLARMNLAMARWNVSQCCEPTPALICRWHTHWTACS